MNAMPVTPSIDVNECEAEKCRGYEPKREPKYRRDLLERAGIDRTDVLYRRRENFKPQLRK